MDKSQPTRAVAARGAIRGPGTGTSDSVPIMASHGEFMINAAAVKKIGLPALEAINAMGDGPKGAIRKMHKAGHMALGGPVDEEAQRLQSISQIPATGGTFPTPAPDGKDNTEFSRNVGNALSAIPGAAPAMGAIRTLGNASKVGGMLSAIGSGAGTIAAKTAPYAVPAAGLGALSAVSSPAATTPAATTLPGATPPVQAMATPTPATTTQVPQQPAGTLPAIPSGAIRRLGNSYSGGNVSGDITVNGGSPTGGVISAQNNLAAENLARRYGQTSGFGPTGAIRGSGQVSSIDTSAGYAADLKQLGEIDKTKAEQNASMQAQADYAQENAMRVSGLGKAARELGALRMNNQTTRRDQDLQAADRGAVRKLSQDRLGLETAKAGQDAKTATLDQKSKQQLMDAQQEYLNAGDDPVKLKAAERKLITLGGKQPQADQFAYAPGGQIIDPTTGQLMTQPGVIFNKATGQQVGPQAQAKPQIMEGSISNVNGKTAKYIGGKWVPQ